MLKYLKYICWCCVPPHLRQNNSENHDRKVDDGQGKGASAEEETGSDDPESLLVGFSVHLYILLLLTNTVDCSSLVVVSSSIGEI